MILLPADPVKIVKMRETFIERALLPSYDELAEEFSVPISTVRKYASQEGWPGMRVAHQDRQIAESEAKGAVLAVLKGDHTVSRKYLNLAIVTLDKLTLTVERLDDKRAESTNAQTINTCMFAAANLAKALHEVGIIGITKTLNGVGKEDNGRWNPQMLQQINLTVQNLTAQAKGQELGDAAGAVASSKPAPVIAPSESKPPAVETDLE